MAATSVLQSISKLADKASVTQSASSYLALCSEDCSAENYDKWATSYDSDVKSLNYFGYRTLNYKWRSYQPDLGSGPTTSKYKILDAGCGTGLLGEDLVSLVPPELVEIHGGDMSAKMLEIARQRAVYADLKLVNVKGELPYEANTFDSILCAGLFGIPEHPGPVHLPNLLRVLKEGSCLFATINKEFYKETKSEWERQARNGNSEVMEDGQIPYREGAVAVLLVVRKNKVI